MPASTSRWASAVAEGIAYAAGTVGFLAVALDLVPLTYRRVGGLHFFRIGRFGGSIYVTRRAA